ncbi:MAG: AAA-like domain-containing protein [Hydrococcus sp. Prado102]|jgi:WD40 repeat protein|nr:AAA-like domain-containing protein [Hydrococcus sp. Prado102]
MYTFEGTLPENNPTYIKRKADDELYEGLKAKKFCYVFNSRKTGKSSLRVRVMNRLQAEGFVCAAIDISLDEIQLATPNQWYFGILDSLTEDFDLDIDLDDWWHSQELLSPLGRLRKFIESVLLVKKSENIVIFIDEIDSILGLNFPIDDFFAFIRACYNRRVDNPAYDRLTFCLLGVASPSTLIEDKKRTPFNIGRGIELTGFTLTEALPLAKGLQGIVAEPEKVFAQLWEWTQGQPFLTQKLCYLVVRHADSDRPNVKQLIQTYVIANWESQDEPEHLKTIRDRLLANERDIGSLLGLYQQIYQQEEVSAARSYFSIEIRLSGIAIEKQGKLTVYNPIYKEVFNQNWIEKQLAYLRPYSQAIAAWLASDCRDESRLLRGKALKDAQIWVSFHKLTEQDYQFLNASERLEKEEREKTFLAERTKQVEALLFQEKKIANMQRRLLLAVTTALFIMTGLGFIALFNYRKALVSEVKAVAESSEALFASNQRLDALVAAIKATRQLQKLGKVDSNLEIEVKQILQQTSYQAIERNRLSGHRDRIYGIAVSPDGKIVASGSADRTVKLWKRDGTLLTTLEGHSRRLVAVAISGDSQIIVSGSADRTVKLWKRDGTLLTTLKKHTAGVTSVAISRDGRLIASASEDKTIKLWKRDGTLLTTLEGHTAGVKAVALSNDAQLIISASEDKTIKLWKKDGTLLNTFKGHTAGVRAVAISADNTLIVSGSRDNTVKLWRKDGTFLRTLREHNAPVYGVAISPDNNWIASASADNTIKIWRKDTNGFQNLSNKTLRGHTNRVWGVAITPDGNEIVSASWDKTVRLWQLDNNLVKTFSGHQDVTISVDFSARIIASASDDKTVKIWNQNGVLLTNFTGHNAEVYAVAISSNSKTIVSGSADRTVKLWQPDGKILKTLKGYQNAVWAVAITPDGKTIVSGSEDYIKIWRSDGTLLNTLNGHQSAVWAVAITPDGKTIVSGSEDNTVKIWHSDGTLLKTLKGHQDTVLTVAITPDGKTIVSGSEDNTVKIWRSDGTLLKTLKGHRDTVRTVAISHDGGAIASGSEDGTIKLWKIDGTLITTLNNDGGSIWDVAFSPDNTQIASVGENKKVIVWNLKNIIGLNLLKHSCDWAQNYLQHNSQVEKENKFLCNR